MSLMQLTEKVLDWKVLIIDDEPDSLEVAKLLLEMYGVTVYTASNGVEGLDKAQTSRPHFIITDLSMPEMSGWELATRLKNEVHTRDIPIIALTAHAMTGDRERAMAVGFHNYLAKPLRPESFVTDIISILLDIPELAFLLNQS